MPKFKKTNKSGEDNRAAWRTPVKLPTTVSNEPIKSLYNQSSRVEANPKSEITVSEPIITARATEAEPANQTQETSNSFSEIKTDDSKSQTPVAPKRLKSDAKSQTSSETTPAEKIAPRRSETEFLRLLKTEKMDFYSLAEILRGSSMALYCVLYSESLGKGESRCQIRQTDLMMRAGINNPATLYKQERWLTTLGLINKSVRLGNHNGASYEVEPLEILPLPQFILAQFGGYLSEFSR